LTINAVFALLTVVFTVFRVLITFKFSIQASKKLHENMLSRIMNAPVNTYFDKTPIGRILNRLSNDLNSVDIEMPFLIGNVNMSFWKLLGCLSISVILIYWCIIPIPFVLAASIYYLNVYLNLQRRLKRLEKTMRSPILQFTAESYTGSATIRAYEGQNYFFKQCLKRMEAYLKCNVHVNALDCWVTLRIQFVSIAMNVLTVLFVVLSPIILLFIAC